ncbi:MAG: glycosyltransferase [Marinilabiliaceae bacterium]|nr:glycosyltransferase [Marinilabiliaceae bacterium]
MTKTELNLQFTSFSVSEWIIFVVVIISFCIQIGIYIGLFTKIKFYKPVISDKKKEPVSVIICSRNEGNNLKQNLPLILSQNYPEYEVIVVNDGSEDDTDLILSVIKNKYPNFYYTTIPADKKFVHAKKLAINIGIKAAKYNHLLFTDADCYPTSNDWISEMMNGFNNEQKELVIGYSPFEKQKGLLNIFIRYDAFWNAVQYLSFAIKGKAFMGVGRNMAYTKNLYHSIKGFSKHLYLSSGDDDLFINQAANKTNTSVVLSINSHMITQPETRFSDWHRQKSRHISTSPHYKTNNKTKILLEITTRQLLWMALIYSIFFPNFAWFFGGALTLKLFIQMIILRGAAKTLDEGKIYWAALFFDFTLPLFLFIFHIENQFRSKQVKWK